MCCWSSYTWPAYIWSVVSVVAAVTVSFSIYFSNWVEIIDSSGANVTSLSPYRICVNQRERITVECSDYLNFDRILSDEWRACTILLGIGACLLILVAITSLFGMVVPRLFSKVVTVLMAITQGIAVLVLTTVVFLFPAGFDEITDCTGSESYHLASPCSVGWAYIVFIVGTVIGIVAVMLSLTPLRTRKKPDEIDHIPYDS